MKKILAIIMVAVIAVMCTACGGLDMSKVKGEWTLSTVNGQSYAEYAASLGVDPSAVAMNWTISDKNVVSSNANGTGTMDIEVKSDGFEILSNGEIWASVKYDEKADTFSYSVKVGDVQYDYVLVRGTSAISAPAADGGEDYVDEGGDYAEDGGEDYAEDGYEEE